MFTHVQNNKTHDVLGTSLEDMKKLQIAGHQESTVLAGLGPGAQTRMPG